MKRNLLIFLLLLSCVLIVILSTYFIFNRKSQSTFLKGAINGLEIVHTFDEENKKTITKYRDVNEIINFIDSIDYFEKPKMTMIIGGETYKIKLFRAEEKYSSEYLIFYHKYIHYVCVNDVPKKESKNIIVNVWYKGNENIFNTVKGFYDKAK